MENEKIKAISLRLKQVDYDKLKRLAQSQDRDISSQIRLILRQELYKIEEHHAS